MKQNLFLAALAVLVLFSCSKEESHLNRLPKQLNFKGSVVSCADFSVNQSLDSKNSNIALSIYGSSRENLGLTINYKTFSFPNKNLKSTILIGERPLLSFCNDVMPNEPNPTHSWNAVSGNIKIKISNVREREDFTLYEITVVLENVVFKNSDTDEERTISKHIIENAPVGWILG